MGINIQDKILSAPLIDLIEWAEETYHSPANQMKYANPATVQFKAGIGRPVFANAFCFSTVDYLHKPEISLTSQLRWKLWLYHVLRDDTPFDLWVGIDYATAYEPSLFGVVPMIAEGREPTYGQPVINRLHDLDRIPRPDFYQSGLMPQAHAMYEALCDLSRDKLKVFFPGFARGPWSMATILRGFNNLFLDSIDQPEFLHRLMQFCVDTRQSWERQRCRFLGISPEDPSRQWKYVAYRSNSSSDLFEDEIDCTLFSVDFYREFIFPYHLQLSDFYHGIHYFHSCGSLTDFLDDLAKLPVKHMQHISSKTDLAKAARILPADIILQYSLDATADVMDATPDHFRERIRQVVHQAQGRRIDICADALYLGGWDTLARLQQLCAVFREGFLS